MNDNFNKTKKKNEFHIPFTSSPQSNIKVTISNILIYRTCTSVK